MEQQKTETRSITADQRKRVEEVCFRSLALIGRNCEYLEQHFDRTGADESTRQAVADIDTAAIQLDRTLTEAPLLVPRQAEPQLSAALRQGRNRLQPLWRTQRKNDVRPQVFRD